MLTSTFALVAIAALLVGAAIQLILALAGFRGQRAAARPHAAELQALRKEMQALQAQLAGAQRRIAAIENRPSAVPPPPAVKPSLTFHPVEPAYELANKLARKGASADELIETCGLSRSEVDLITRLNQAASADNQTLKQ
jgi:hypothetical protein